MLKILIAAVQLISTPNVDENLNTVNRLILQAVEKGAKLVLLPEFFASINPANDNKARLAIAEKYLDFSNAPIQKFLRDSAIKHGIWLIGGSVPLISPSKNKILNSLLAFNPDGECICRYDKIHLFKYKNENESYDESLFIEAGNKIEVFSVNINNQTINIFPSICYDVRFPELYRQGADKFTNKSIDIILLPAAFAYSTGMAHWQVLLRARAIENQCYVLASAQGGEHKINGITHRKTFGNTIIINSWGEVLDCQKQGEKVVIAEFDREAMGRVRTNLPAMSHRVL